MYACGSVSAALLPWFVGRSAGRVVLQVGPRKPLERRIWTTWDCFPRGDPFDLLRKILNVLPCLDIEVLIGSSQSERCRSWRGWGVAPRMFRKS